MRRLLLAAALIAASVSFLQPAPASAFTNSVNIKNNTDKCAWITMYFTNGWPMPWDIFHHLPEGKPQFLRPGASHVFAMGAAKEMKIRAEVMQNGDCSGHKIADTYDIRTDGSTKYINYQATLMKTNNPGGYNLWFI